MSTTPTGVTARYQGQANLGTTNYFYWVQAIHPSGTSQLSAAGSTGAKCPAGLSSNNIVNVQWNPVPGATGYYLYKTTTSAVPANGASCIFIATAQTGFKDDGSVATFTQVPQYSGIQCAHMLYDFNVDGGVHTSAIVPKISDTIPINALVFGGILLGVASFVGPTAVTIGTTAGSGAATILASTAIAGVAINSVVELLGTNSQAATQKAPFRMTAAGQMNLTLTVADATAGCIEVFVFYVVPSNA